MSELQRRSEKKHVQVCVTRYAAKSVRQLHINQSSIREAVNRTSNTRFIAVKEAPCYESVGGGLV